jgi:hypothetical protein
MAVVLPVMIVLTVLTSGDLPRPSRLSSVAHVSRPAIRHRARPRHDREGALFEAKERGEA